MPGIGLCPAGTCPAGLGVVVSAPAPRTRAGVTWDTVSPRLDPVTRAIALDASGTPVLADGVEQRVQIRLSTDKGSSVIRQLGNDLRKIDRITDNFQKRVDTTVRAALADMVNSGEIVLESVTAERF